MTTPKQRLIEAVNKRKMEHLKRKMSETEFSFRVSEINHFLKLIDEILPNE